MAVSVPTTQTITSAEQALEIAQEFIADDLTDLMGTGAPWRMGSPMGNVWVVPIWIAYPGYEQVETIGSVAVDETTGNIVSWTPIEEIKENARQFHARDKADIQAGFQTLRADSATGA